MSNPSNPFQSPQSVDAPFLAPRPGDNARLRRIAERQRLMLFAILANIGANVAAMAARNLEPLMAIGLLVAIFAVLAFTIVAAVRLAIEVYESTAIGILCGVLVLFPCIGLITLLVVNQKATGELQRAGIKVGFMGANMSQFPREQ